jgi:hypothetical protein
LHCDARLKPKAGSAEACGEVIVRVGDDLKVGEQSLAETLVLSKRKLYIHHCLVPFYRAASVSPPGGALFSASAHTIARRAAQIRDAPLLLVPGEVASLAEGIYAQAERP